MSEGYVYERISADDIRPGHFVARARTHHFREVRSIHRGPKSVRIEYCDGGAFDKPRKAAVWWAMVGAPERGGKVEI